MDKDSFLNYVKSKNIYIDIAKTVKTRFDTSNYEIERPLSQEKAKKLSD